MISFLYLIGAVILILAWITMIGIIIMPIYIFSKWMAVSLYKRYQSRKSTVPQPNYLTLPDRRVRYLP